ncbi:methionine aminopeptidase [Psychrosphaera saromensis]|uniref:Methionine aminopeptidase n=1 Tax=Psychrosphaera saromensis TaxID=716813 RepID=A0A2S7USI1_9GAMM|nr:type I methionyl aminopeptidase [Psychrosphaera saromensis]PQJ52946.1 type I methionyl aminopeptidase [Psychrosphaera saromensis]GHB77702.1 methionine aminopeptidase [Psychrosphaera saromensis]GLQ12896.1 methionine aminopeptidase [Psychrosphaera saromensis]
MSKAILKNEQEIALMRESGRLLAQVFKMLDDFICEGMTTLEIDTKVEDYIRNELNARPASKGQYDYKFSLNSSINDVVCHGVPSDTVKINAKDIINLDITLEKDGFISDSSKMFTFSNTSVEAKRLVKTTYDAMWKGINVVKPGARLGDVGYAIQKHAEQAGYSVVREYCGHGIGREMHEDPQVLHYGRPNTGLVLKAGMTFTIEPMINQGTHKIKNKKDGWTVVTKDKKLSAQWEHTILVTKTGFEVLTLRHEETL